MPPPTEEELSRLQSENASLRHLLQEFKQELRYSLSTSSSSAYDYENTNFDAAAYVVSPRGVGGSSSPVVVVLPQSPSPQQPPSSVTSLSSPAILWKSLCLERKRAGAASRLSERLRATLDTIADQAAVTRLVVRVASLEQELRLAAEENRALSTIQRSQEKRLLDDDLLEKEWPVRLAAMEQELGVAVERSNRTKAVTAELRKKGVSLNVEVEALRREKLQRKDEEERDGTAARDRGEETYSEAEYNKLVECIAKLNEEKGTLKNSARAFKVIAEREVESRKALVAKKDEEIKDLKRQLEESQVEARQTLLNMKELKKTLGSIAVGNMKVREVKALLPRDLGDEDLGVMDLKAIETILPHEVDCERTKFMSPRPPPSEVKQQLRYTNPLSVSKSRVHKESNKQQQQQQQQQPSVYDTHKFLSTVTATATATLTTNGGKTLSGILSSS